MPAAFSQICLTSHLSAGVAGFDDPPMQVRQDLNPQPPVLETGALPVELLTYLSSI